jgi:hypothetical protein
VLGSFFAVAVVLSAIGWVVGLSTQVGHVRVTNDTTQTWSFCGSDCAHHETVLLPGDATTVSNDVGTEIFLVQEGRETGDCVFPAYTKYSSVRISARQACVQ